jgi:hypothetical protein
MAIDPLVPPVHYPATANWVITGTANTNELSFVDIKMAFMTLHEKRMYLVSEWPTATHKERMKLLELAYGS